MQANISRLLNREIQIPEAGRCIVTIPFNKDLTQNAALLHGAIFFEAADTAGFIAANSVETTYSVLTLDYNITYIRPVSNKGIYAEGKVIHKGRSIIICTSSVYAEDGKLVAEGRGTYYVSNILLNDIQTYREAEI